MAGSLTEETQAAASREARRSALIGPGAGPILRDMTDATETDEIATETDRALIHVHDIRIDLYRDRTEWTYETSETTDVRVGVAHEYADALAHAVAALLATAMSPPGARDEPARLSERQIDAIRTIIEERRVRPTTAGGDGAAPRDDAGVPTATIDISRDRMDVLEIVLASDHDGGNASWTAAAEGDLVGARAQSGQASTTGPAFVQAFAALADLALADYRQDSRNSVKRQIADVLNASVEADLSADDMH